MEVGDVVRKCLPGPEMLVVEGVNESDAAIIIQVRSNAMPSCPACAGSIVSYHSRYERRIRDLPWQGQPVELHVQVRRFRCRNRAEISLCLSSRGADSDAVKSARASASRSRRL